MTRITPTQPIRMVLTGACALALAGAATAASAAPQSKPDAAAPPAVTPKLAPGVKAEDGYVAMQRKWVVANPSPLYADIMETSKVTGHTGDVGAPVQAIAKVKGWEWYLVGRDGEGVGYVPRDLLKPASS